MLNCYRCIYALKSIIQPRFFHYIPSVRRSRRSYLQIFVNISFPENFASFTPKYLCWSLFFNKAGGFRPATLSKRDSNTGALLWNLWNSQGSTCDSVSRKFIRKWNLPKRITLFICRDFNPLSANPTKQSNTLKQFAGNWPRNCLSVFGHFVILALKGLIFVIFLYTKTGKMLYMALQYSIYLLGWDLIH